MIQTDYLIIGSGVAGLTFAIKIATKFPNKKITIVTNLVKMNQILNMHKVALPLFKIS